MQKILVSDLIGTLIPRDYYLINYLYGDETLTANEENHTKSLIRAFNA